LITFYSLNILILVFKSLYFYIPYLERERERERERGGGIRSDRQMDRQADGHPSKRQK